MAHTSNDSQHLFLHYEGSSASDGDDTQPVHMPSSQTSWNDDLPSSRKSMQATDDNMATNRLCTEPQAAHSSKIGRVSQWLNEVPETISISDDSSTDSESEQMLLEEGSEADSDEENWINHNGHKAFFPNLQKHFAAYFTEMGNNPSEQDIAKNKDEVANWLFNYVTHRNVVRRIFFNKMW